MIQLIRQPLFKQFLISILSIIITFIICYFINPIIGYKTTAFILMLLISILAMLVDVWPVLFSALVSSLAWNYFFIPPIGSFKIDKYEDSILFLMYFVIVMVHIVLTNKIRKARKMVSEKEEKEKTILLYNTLINSLSHELKTPVATILMAVESLKSDNPNIDKSQRMDLLNELEISSLRLNKQVENLLNMSRLESGFLRIKADWCDLNEMIGSLVDKSFGHIKTHTIHFHSNEKLPLLKLDRGLMEIAIQNILINCLQHNAPGTVVDIKTDYTSDICRIIISDNGKGFPYGEIDFVFDRFYRGKDSKSGGTGLGLSIAKGYVEAHNGSIKVNNIEGGGAKFTIRFPAQSSYINQLKNE